MSNDAISLFLRKHTNTIQSLTTDYLSINSDQTQHHW